MMEAFLAEGASVQAFVSLATGEHGGAAYLLTGDGLQALSDPGQAQRQAPAAAGSVDRR
jgi:TRAP-type uncharacterized transport system substrate-binding protein